VGTGFKCCDCGIACHEKCREGVPKACTKYKSVQGHGQLGGERLMMDVQEQGSPDRGNNSRVSSQGGNNFEFNTTQQDENSNIVYQGYLYKKGALLKAWKPRWFVLDTIKHQLRYYDSRDDYHCKGTVDLSEVRSVTQPASLPPGAPKKVDEGCAFDLHTIRRTYSLCAENRQQALEWQEKIQNCL